MILNNNKKLFVFLYILICELFVFVIFTTAEVMNSNNYRIEKDSLNSGGLDLSQSSNYTIKDTVGEVATGKSSSDLFYMNAGYRQMDDVYLSISGPSSITMSPNIGGVTGGVSDGSGVWNVKTDSSSGYYLSIKATSSPSLVSYSSGDNFSDYTTQIANTPDYDWFVGSSSSEFGFSVYNPVNQYASYKNNGSQCSVGTSITSNKCWDYFTTSYKVIVQSLNRTSVDGDNTSISFKAEAKEIIKASGEYGSVLVVTAIPN